MRALVSDFKIFYHPLVMLDFIYFYCHSLKVVFFSMHLFIFLSLTISLPCIWSPLSLCWFLSIFDLPAPAVLLSLFLFIKYLFTLTGFHNARSNNENLLGFSSTSLNYLKLRIVTILASYRINHLNEQWFAAFS